MKSWLLLTAMLVSSFSIMQAGDEGMGVTRSEEWFDRGAAEFELMSGVVVAQIAGSRTSYDYTDTELRVGWMLYSPHGSELLRGNLELLATAGGGGIFSGPGSGYGSTGAMLRYNFVQPRARLVPYFQIGAAAFISDISENKRQEDIGGTFEADLEGAAGTRFFICRRWSLNTELFLQHISNADTQPRNVGINALGGLLGISRQF
jgi:Lipid A 3-O-deacylase (PagL)